MVIRRISDRRTEPRQLRGRMRGQLGGLSDEDGRLLWYALWLVIVPAESFDSEAHTVIRVGPSNSEFTIRILAFWLAAMPVLMAQEIDFNRDVRPILSNNCLLCHGPDVSGLQAGLRLDVREIATKALESGEIAIVPGDPDASAVIHRLTAEDPDLRMPPAETGRTLSPAETDMLRRWIAAGAPFARHWSLTPPVREQPPVAPDPYTDWPRNAIDHFALDVMLKQGLRPSPEADRYALVRRVFLDLIGLPPTIEEADAFVASKDPQAYEAIVDALLERPEFGEHWARKWLDLARYADSAGYADDPERTIWAYRDWVIRAINQGMPFDQFTIEQLAGDLLPDPTEDQLIATAFHRNTMTNNEGGTQDEEFRNVAIVDRVNTTMAVWMGTTIACAQCHNHKYDPISQEEYFQLFAIFNNTDDADRRDESPVVQIFTEAQKQRQTELDQQITELRSVLDTPTPELAESQRQWEAGLQTAPTWSPAQPLTVRRDSQLPIAASADASIFAQQVAETDSFVVDLAADGLADSPPVAGIRLVTLPQATLPGNGAGLAGGNFVITRVSAQVVPVEDTAPMAQFVRITNHGRNQILSLAEVEVFSGARNIAPTGSASQHSTAFDGPAARAIDGNANGDYHQQSVTHTDTVTDPWWELDFKSPQAIERIVVWNRTDNGLHARLSDFSIELLDGSRTPIWSQRIAEPPNPSAEFRPSRIRDIAMQTAFADFTQSGFDAADVLRGETGASDGWAVGGSIAASHELILVPQQPIVVDAGHLLRIRIEHNSPHGNHLLASFRIELTADAAAIDRARVPPLLLAVLERPADQRSESEAADLARYFRMSVAESLRPQREALAKAEQARDAMKPATSIPILKERAGDRRETRLQYRGNYLDPGPVVTAAFPAVFQADNPAGGAVDRLALARWLVDESNPLTARVLANRYWEALFGRGLVVTSEEFGSQGEPPTHPRLLDWLATELHRNHWNTKALLRLIVTSATYRQSARISPDQPGSDPDNRWLARGPRVRLSAETVRDQALFAAGLLSSQMFGEPVRPPQPSLGLTAAFGSSTDWQTSTGDDRYRRGIYTTWRRSNPYPSMATFDAPNREVCTIRRNSTNTPLQSLVTLNDPVYVEAAQALARRVLQQHDSVEPQLAAAFRYCLIRPPTAAETAALENLYADSRARFENQGEEAMKLATDPLGPLPESLNAADAAAMTVVCNVLLNLDEMFLKR